VRLLLFVPFLLQEFLEKIFGKKIKIFSEIATAMRAENSLT
jgi:hypothetical protein